MSYSTKINMLTTCAGKILNSVSFINMGNRNMKILVEKTKIFLKKPCHTLTKVKIKFTTNYEQMPAVLQNLWTGRDTSQLYDTRF